MLSIVSLFVLVSLLKASNAADCVSKFSEAIFRKNFNYSASSESIDYTASDVFTFGWCAATNTGTPHIDVDFKLPYGISGITIQGPTNKDTNPYPTNVLVKYVPNGGDTNNFIHFPLQEGKLEIKLNQPGQAQSNFAQSIAVRKLRFIIQSFSGEACLKIDLTGCTINELCSGGCQQNGGLCVMEDTCRCPQGSLGDNCELKACVPATLGLADGRIGADQVTASSQDPVYNEAEIGYSNSKKGWCPALTDQSPWVQIRLDQPKAVSVFEFTWSGQGGNKILTEFELQYIAAIDSSRRFRTYATDIPAMNGTHIFSVTIEPAAVTDTIRIVPSKWDNRPCFKLEIQGCDPKALCSNNWCLNGGSCIGQNVCKCPVGFVGSRCEQATSNITVTNMTFAKIENNILFTNTATLQFHVTGNVNLQVIENKPAVSINGLNSCITLNQTTGIPSCVTDINHCNNGFTFTIDVNFGQLLDNTYIISSGGNLPDHSGITLYYANNQLHYIVSTTTQIWTVAVNYSPVLHQWQNFELSWNKHLGIEILVNGHTLGSNSRPSPRPTSSKIVNLCIACSHTTTVNVNINMQVSAIHSWSFDRTELVNAGVKEPPVTTTTSNPSTTPKISTAPATSPSTSAPTKTPAPTTTVKATIPTTTQIPVPTFSWNLTTVTNNVIIGSHYNLTVHGSPVVSSAGIQINSSMQYIEFGSHNENCLIKPETCSYGLTIRFTIKFNKYAENTYFFTSGGQLPDGVGLAIVYRFGKIHFILTTANQSWFINCKKNEIPPNKYHTIMLSWQLATGLEVFVNNILVETSKVPDPHQSTLMNATTVYFGKQPTSSVQVDFILQTITIWYVHVDILVEQGKCEPPVRPTTTQSTKVTTAPTKPTATTNRVTFSSLMTTSGPQQCPAGCVSITTAQSSVTTAKPPVTATTRRSTTPVPTTRPKPSATPPPPTTRKPIPDFNQFPTIHVTVEKDNNAYIACAFKPTTAKDVQIEASLHVEGKIRLVITVSGNTGLAMFAVSKVDMYLYGKEIKCSVKAHYIGSSLATQSFFSNVFRPLITVSPGRVIVIEGHSKEFVTVTSTAPPQFYCCDGCKGQCQVHIVGTFQYERYFQKCNRDYISQAVIESAKPPNFNEHICGYALTVQNWNQKNKIEIKATIDGRRDGDHTIKLDIIGNVYNQPPTAQITVKPYTFTVTAVQVTVKDNDHGLSQCKSVNDPHMRTFDGQNYDNMREGEFILFRHKTLPFEVRAVYYKCSKRSHATCNCAVAVKSGDDVIAVTGCQGYEGGHPGQGHGIGLLFQQLFGSHGHAHGHNKDELAKTPMTIQIYKNGELTPGTHIRRIGCGQKYEIELPTGMVVTVQQSWKPFINIWIQGSSSDRNQAEGLCGNFDGSRTNDVTPSVSSFINHWKVNNGVFFNGVGVSSHSVTATYCSCVHGKDKVCLAGVGAFRCASLRYDITATLVQHAKRPVLSRRKRQADTDPVPPSTEIPPDENDFTYEEAEKKCFDTIMNSKVTTSCQPILTSNLTGQIDNCAHDYNATGNFEWAADALRDIIVDCVEAANTLRVANETGNTNVTDEFPDIDNIDEVLGKLEVCLEDCGDHGNCTDGVCVCEDGYSGIHCNISKQTKPTVLSAPYLCDIMDTSDCMAAPIFGDNFVDSDTLNCHYEFLKIGEGVADTGDKGKVRAVYISLNQITCPLPRLQSARLSVSNDGQDQSNNSTIHVVYSSTCFECTVTPTCTRKDNNCLIDGVCYENSVTRPGDNCQICRPVANSSEWSRNNIDECVSETVAIVQDNDKEKTQILALAIVCGVLAAIILIGLIFCIKARMGKKPTKGEYGEYDFTGSQNLHRDPFTAVNNLTYDEKM